MTVSSDDEGWTHALGYCAGWREQTRAELEADPVLRDMTDSILKDQEKSRPFREKFHTTGHEHAAEARRCFAEYELDHHLDLTAQDRANQRECIVCGSWTSARAKLGVEFPRVIVLCETHRTEEIVRRFVLAEHVE